MVASLTSPAAFDRVASRYDELTVPNSLHSAMREESLSALRRAFRPGTRVLEVGCGTGVEAAALAKEGVRVVATDASSAMVERARARVVAEGLESSVEVIRCGAAGLVPAIEARGPFDGAYSSFGPLNCEPDFAGTARGIARLLRPGAPLVLTLVNRTCAWELLLYSALGRPGKAYRRLRRPARVPLYDEASMDAFLPSPAEVEAALATDFESVRWRGLLVARPPPYLAKLYSSTGPVAGALASLDRRVSSKPFFRALGDHFLVEARRR